MFASDVNANLTVQNYVGQLLLSLEWYLMLCVVLQPL